MLVLVIHAAVTIAAWNSESAHLVQNPLDEAAIGHELAQATRQNELHVLKAVIKNLEFR